MKLLLDTHIWLWSALQPQRISRRVAKQLSDQANELWLSPISVWELGILHSKGRTKTPQDIPAWVANSIEELRLTEAPLTIEVALAVSELNFPHGDPADHFLAASAKVFDFTLVTADENLIGLRGIRVLANRQPSRAR
jgi:PIN domain nuclease of toxin-antitoxin system